MNQKRRKLVFFATDIGNDTIRLSFCRDLSVGCESAREFPFDWFDRSAGCGFMLTHMRDGEQGKIEWNGAWIRIPDNKSAPDLTVENQFADSFTVPLEFYPKVFAAIREFNRLHNQYELGLVD